ncbi:hypothetical protein Tco_0465414 [Tanacetum coccineum]
MDHRTSSIPQIAYHSPQASTKPMNKFPQMDSSLDVHVFSQGDDLIACLNKAMAFLTAVVSSRFPSTNNQLRFNPRNQATIQDSRVIVQQVQGRQGQSYSCTGYKGNATSFGGHNTSEQEKAMLAEAQEAGQILDEEQLAFLADPGIPDGQAAQKTISNNTAFQTEDLYAYDFDCDDVSNAKAVLMANLSNYASDVISEKAQRIKPTLYDGSVISSKHVVMPVIDDDETLILEELNKLSEDFGKRFIPQQELSAEQAFWLQTSHPNTDQSDISPVKIKAPRELPKASLINTSIKKLKYHLSMFDTMVKKKITPDDIIEGEWGFEHTKAMEAAVQQCSVDKQCFEIHKKELFLDNDQLLHQTMSQDVMLCVMNSTTVFGDSVNVERQSSESCDKCSDLDAKLLKKQNAYNELSKSYSQLEKHCISLELTIQLNQENFQTDKSCNNQNALEILEYFENNNLKAQQQAKDTTIRKLKEHIKSMRENDKEEKVKHDTDEIKTKNIELEHSQIQEKVFVTTTLQNELRRLKGKNVLDNATTIAPKIFKLDLDPLAPRLLKNRDTHIDYLKYTQEQADILWGIVKQAKAKQPLDNVLDFACCLDYSLVSGLRMLKTYDRKPLSAHDSSVKFLGIVDSEQQDCKIMGYGDYQLENVTISSVYYIEGLKHNLFSIGQLCDSDLEVAFWKNTCFIQNLEGVDILS